MIPGLAERLAAEARSANERRLLVLSGDRDAGREAAAEAVDAGGYARSGTAWVGAEVPAGFEEVPPARAGSLLGTTQESLVFDAHDRLDPNAVGATVGTVDGGGLFVLLAPDLDGWPDRRDGFDETLAVPPFPLSSVTGRFRGRFVRTLRAHPGVAIVDLDAGSIDRDGHTDPAPPSQPEPIEGPQEARFPRAAYEACLTADQAETVAAFEALLEPGAAVVVEADRGRGKSSAAGITAACLAAVGADVLLTAPARRHARPALERADAVVDALGERADGPPDGPSPGFSTTAGGRFGFRPPGEAVAAEPDVLLVDEAAAIPVSRLETFLDVGRVGFTTTVHGYEGTGRGFAVRFRDALSASPLDVTDVRLTEPIRYAAGDPVEVWSFRALLLDASPPADQLVADADTGSVRYEELDPDRLVVDEPLLGEAFGLLVLAHYRTEPADLARLLDAPNVSVRALLEDGHVVSIALLAREGNLPADLRAHMYEGGRVRGNMLPDVLTSQLRDEAAGVPEGLRVLRIATHAAARSRGLGSHLLERIREEFGDEVDWLGTGYGATPALLRFWARNGYATVHLSTTRNAASGEHSAVMLSPTSDAGRDLLDRHAGRFVDRIESVLGDALSDLDPDVVRGALRTATGPVALDLDDVDWRLVAAVAYGPGLLDVDPGPFRRLVLHHLVGPEPSADLSDRQERLLVARVLQSRDWGAVADRLGYDSRRQCMLALGEALRPIVDAHGGPAAREERERYLE